MFETFFALHGKYLGAEVLRKFGADFFFVFLLASIFQTNGMFKPVFCADFWCADFGAHFWCADFCALFCADFWCADFAPIFAQIFRRFFFDVLVLEK